MGSIHYIQEAGYDQGAFMQALNEMPPSFIQAFEAEQAALAEKIMSGGHVKSEFTARYYAGEILSRLIWKEYL